jgi:hypothetical protein
MKKYIFCSAVVCVMLFSATVMPVMADVLFSNPSMGTSAPNAYMISPPPGGYYLVLDDFSLSSDSVIDWISFRGWTSPGAVVTQVNLSIYADNGGAPGTGIVGVPSFPVTGTDTGHDCSGYDVYDYVLRFDYFPLNSGVYWLGLSNATTSPTSPSTYAFWELNDSLTGPMTGNGLQYASNSDSYSRNLGDFVFGVNGTGSGTSVPEPTTMLLLSFGLMGLAGIRRKFKK